MEINDLHQVLEKSPLKVSSSFRELEEAEMQSTKMWSRAVLKAKAQGAGSEWIAKAQAVEDEDWQTAKNHEIICREVYRQAYETTVNARKAVELHKVGL